MIVSSLIASSMIVSSLIASSMIVSSLIASSMIVSTIIVSSSEIGFITFTSNELSGRIKVISSDLSDFLLEFFFDIFPEELLSISKTGFFFTDFVFFFGLTFFFEDLFLDEEDFLSEELSITKFVNFFLIVFLRGLVELTTSINSSIYKITIY